MAGGKEGASETYDPLSDPEIIQAASLTRFAWGESGAAAQARYLELMKDRGVDETEALQVLVELNSQHRPVTTRSSEAS